VEKAKAANRLPSGVDLPIVAKRWPRAKGILVHPWNIHVCAALELETKAKPLKKNSAKIFQDPNTPAS
jgi:hypothetical protein